MRRSNFMEYNKDAEKTDGDYWKFLDVTSKYLLDEGIFLDDISKIIKEINNEELKTKMKKKIFDLIMEKGFYFNGLEKNLDIFTSDELKLIFKHEYDDNIIKYVSDEERNKYYLSDIIYFIFFLKSTNDPEWECLMIKNILNILKNNKDKSLLVKIIEYTKYNTNIQNNLINEYYNFLPIEYKNYLKMNQDPNYIYKKSLEFMDKNIDIGIDPRISIAPEIEANNDYGIQINLNDQKGFEDFRVSTDATVPNGIEIAPRKPFHNKKEDVAKLCALCEAMKDTGYYYCEISGNAAGQINLGLDYLDSKEAILNFYQIYGNCEELLYYICNEEGQLFRQEVYVNSRIKPISEIIGKRVLDEELSRDDVIRLFNNRYDYNEDKALPRLQYKKNSVCLRGTNEKDYRLEFRIPNGGCNYKTWIDNIRLFAKMMEVSKRLADMMKKDYLTSEEEKLIRLQIDLQDNTLSLENKLIILMDLLFQDNNIKKIYYKRYISTIKKIKETKTTKYMNTYNPYEPGFDEVEFVSHYKSRLDPDYNGDGCVEYNPENGILTHNKKK
ncbi:MAG: amidoligase family protein [Bacilli bacterium]|nr:amidoligase family protein [Bacilli bacterium]